MARHKNELGRSERAKLIYIVYLCNDVGSVGRSSKRAGGMLFRGEIPREQWLKLSANDASDRRYNYILCCKVGILKRE